MAAEEKFVLVTGAGARLGAEIARSFAAAGWTVACHYNAAEGPARQVAAGIEAQGGRAFTVQADLSTEAGCRALVAELRARTGKLDCLVNNASTFEDDAATTFTQAQLSHQLQVNLIAPLTLSQGMAVELTREDPSGSPCVIHILDQKVLNLNPDYFSYTVSKLALERAVALQAQALAPRLRVCGVAPGLMYLSGPQSAENFAAAGRINVLRRPIDPHQVAQTCVFLAGNPCITGVTLAVDNGQHLVPLERDVMFVVDELFRTRTP